MQKEIDRVAIKMLGLTWDSEVLNTLYGTIKFELDAMQIIFGRITKGEKTDKKNVRRVGETLKLHKQV
ncbi:MAG: hypothetical protein LM564_02025 [Desulfurococcaceae archaeon]|nr:hypothetical protein [Desulfurococcaceae archaeon]